MRAIETETQTSQASLQEKKKRKRRKVLLLLLLLLLLLGLTFTSVSRFFWNSSRDTASTDPRTPAQVEVIETGDDANTKKSITGLESMVASLQQSVQELESHDHPLPSSDDDLPPQSISYDAYQNLKDNNHLDQPVNTSILTRGIITNEFFLKTAKLVDISDVNEEGLSDGEILKWDEYENEWVAAKDKDSDTTYEAGNGLTLEDEVFSLGGSLSEATTLDLEGFAFTFTDGDVTVDDSLYATALYQNGNVVCDMSGNCGGGGVLTLTLAGDSGTNQTINNNDTITISGGSGLSSVGSATDTLTLNIGAGSGITVGTNDVSVDQAFAFTWTGAQSWSNTTDFNGDVSIADTDIALDGASTNFTTSGDFSINTNDFFIQQSDGNIGVGNTSPGYTLDVTGSIATSDDLYISGIGLNDTASNTTSGAYLIGAFDEFTNSNSATVQGVLADLDAAITGTSHSPVTLAGAYDYLTLTGQQITLHQIDLTTDVTGILPLTNGGTNADLSGVSTGGLIYRGPSGLAGSGSLTGILKGNGSSAPTAITGTTNYVTRWIDANTLGTGILYDDATNVGIGTSTPNSLLDVVGGNIRSDGDVIAGDFYLGYDNFSATLTTFDTDEALTINPNGTGVIYIQGSTYYIESNGLYYVAGLATNNHSPTSGEIRADVFRDGDSNYYIQPADLVTAGVFAGNIGIGTTSPDYALQVNGVIAPESTNQDLGTTSLRWDLFANTINADSTVTLTGLGTGTDNTVLILNASNQVTTDEIDPRVWGSSLVDGLGNAGYIAYWSDADTLTSEQYLSVLRGGLGGDVTPAGAGEILYSTGTTSYDSLAAGANGFVLVSGGAGAPTWVDPNSLGASYWQKVDGVLSPALAEPIAATSAATTVATFTANGSNLALRAGGVSEYASFNNVGDLTFTNASGSNIDATGTLTIGGTNQTGLILGRTGISTRIANLTTDGVVYTSGTDGTLNTEAQLAITRGGTNSTATPTAGGIAYGDGSAYAFSSAGTIGQAFLSGGSGTPTWGTLGLTYGGTNADLSAVATGGLIYKDASALAGTGALTGVLKGNGASAPSAMTGTTNYVTRWTDANTLGIGILYDDGTNVGIGTTSPDFALQVNGVIAPETTDQDLGTTSLRWDIFANTLNADSTITLTGLNVGTDNTVLILNGSNQVETREIDPQVWSSDLITGAGTNGYVTYWTGTDTIGAEQYLNTIRGGLGNDVTAAGAGEILYSTGTTSYDSLAAGANGYVLASGGAGAPTWVDPATLGTNFWQYVNGAFSPRAPYTNNTDLLVGSDATEGAKFAVLNVFPGSGTPTASVSSGVNGAGAYLTADGTLATTRRQSLTIGNSSTYDTTGDVFINSNGTGNVAIGTTTANAKLVVAGSADVSQFILQANATQSNSNGLLLFQDSSGSPLLEIHSDDISNAFFGMNAGQNNAVSGLNGVYNTFLGSYAGAGNATGSYNTFVGTETANNTDSGDENTALGYHALSSNSAGSRNTAIGVDALLSVEGSNNISLGYQAGDNLLSGDNNIIIGYGIDTTSTTISNSLNIGNIVFGTTIDGTGTTISTGNIGIGTSSPGQKLDVAGNIELANYVYFGNAASEYLRWDASNFILSDDLLPATDDTSDLGSNTARWRDLYLGGETIHLGTSTTDEGTISYDTATNILGISTDSTTNGDIAFFTDDLFLDKSAGNVGINTTTPAQALHVIGDVRISGLTASLPVKTNATNDLISGAINLASAEVTGILPLAHGGTNADLSGAATGSIIYKGVSALQASGSLTGVLKGNGSSAPTAMTGTQNYVTRWTDANTIGTGVLYDNGTNVGIGTSTPSSFILEVAGSIGPTGNNAYDLGSDTRRWANVYATNFYQNGNAVCDVTGNCAAVGNLWQVVGDALSPATPYTNNADLLIGSSATASAKFAVLNIFPGSGTPSASVSSGLSGTSMFMTADGTLATQNRMSLTIGNSSTYNTTGNVFINPNGTGNVGIGTTSSDAKVHIAAGALDDNLDYALKLQKGTSATGATGILFSTRPAPNTGKGALIYRRDNLSEGRGDFHFLQNSTADNTDAALGQEVMTIKNGGNVGIGTTAPNEKLELWDYGSYRIGGPDTSIVDGTELGGLEWYADDNSALQAYESVGYINILAKGTWDGSSSAANMEFGIRPSVDALPVTRMVIQQNGNVGIGTTASSATLHVSSAGTRDSVPSSALFSDATDTTEGLFIGYNSTSNYGIIAASDLGTAWQNIALQPTAGNVGIGNTSPAATLHISSTTSPSLTIDPGANATVDPTISLYDTGTTAGFQIMYDNTVGATYFKSIYDNVAGDIHFQTRTAGTPITAMTIESAGNVGINSATPIKKFEVETTASTDGIAVDGTTNPAYSIYSGGTLRGFWGTATVASAFFTGTAINDTVLRSEASSNLHLGVGTGAPSITINSSNNVGIGTVGPATMLHVNGTADVSPTAHGLFVLGPTTGANIAMDQNEIMARNNGVAADIYINNEGADTILNGGGTGSVGIGVTGPGTKLDVAGSIRASSQLISTVATGTAPLAVSSTTAVANLNADMTDGYHATAYNTFTGNAIVTRHGSGYIFSNYYNMTANDVSSGVTKIPVETGNDGYLRWGDAASVITFLNAGTGLDADTLDGISSGSFLRSDTDNSVTSSGVEVTFPSNTTIASGTGDLASLEVYQGTIDADAFMQFHVAGDYAGYLGIDGVIEDFVVGGWSYGATQYRLWHAGSDGAGSGLDADLLDGLTQTTAATANTIMARDASGDTNVRYLVSSYVNMSHAQSARTTDDIFYSSDDNYVRKNTAAGFRQSLDVPTRTGGNASGTWGINITGNAATADSADTAASATTLAVNPTNCPLAGYYASGITANGTAEGCSASIVGNAATATVLATPRTLWGNSFNGSANISGAIAVPNINLASNGAVEGTNNISGGYGVWGTTTVGYGVYGYANGNGRGVNGESTGTAGIGVRGVGVAGGGYDFYAGGAGVDYGTSSSVRWKSDLAPIENALDKVLAMRGLYYTWDEEHGGYRDMGMLAEEVMQYVPEIVAIDPSDPGYATGMDYGKLTPVLVEAIKEQQQQISSLSNSSNAQLYFTSAGDLAINGSATDFTVTPVGSSPLAIIIGASQAVVGNITAGLIDTRELVVQQSATIADLSVNSLKISGQTIDDYVRSIVQLELQNQPNALPDDAIAQDFNSGMVIHNYNTTVTIVQSPTASSSTTFSSTSSGALAITPEINVTEVTQVMPDPRFDVLATLVSWSDAAVDGVRTLFFNAPTVFRYLAWFQGPVKVNADTSGTITIPADTLKARVSFSKPFPEVPSVYVTFADGVSIAHTITDVNASGFTINFANAPATDLTIQWLALLRDDSEVGPSLEIMETNSGSEPATVPSSTPTPTPQNTPGATPEPTSTPTPEPTPTPASGSSETATPSATGLSDLLDEETTQEATEPAETASPSGETP